MKNILSGHALLLILLIQANPAAAQSQTQLPHIAKFSPDSTQLFFSKGTTTQLIDVATGNVLATFQTKLPPINIVFSQDGSRAAFLQLAPIGVFDIKDEVDIYDIKSQKIVLELGADKNIVNAVFAANANKILISCSDNHAESIDIATGKTELVFSSFDRNGKLVPLTFFSPDGSLVFVVSLERVIEVFDSTDGKSLSKFTLNATIDAASAATTNGEKIFIKHEIADGDKAGGLFGTNKKQTTDLVNAADGTIITNVDTLYPQLPVISEDSTKAILGRSDFGHSAVVDTITGNKLLETNWLDLGYFGEINNGQGFNAFSRDGKWVSWISLGAEAISQSGPSKVDVVNIATGAHVLSIIDDENVTQSNNSTDDDRYDFKAFFIATAFSKDGTQIIGVTETGKLYKATLPK